MDQDTSIAYNIEQARVAIVKVRQLDRLFFETSNVPGARCIDAANVKRLVHRFQLEDCHRLDPATWISCELPRSDLHDVLSATSAEASLTDQSPPEISLPEHTQLRCFQGQHRLAAAREFFDLSSLWWIVVVYDSNILTEAARRKLREGDYPAQEFLDGEIYRNARLCELRGDATASKKWMAKWSVSKCREFDQLHHPRKKDFHMRFRDTLTELIGYPGVWKYWQMGSHILSWQVPDELTNYVNHIKNGLHELTGHVPERLDPTTMELLEGRWPSLSQADRLYVESIFDNMQAYPLITDPVVRADLKRRTICFPKMIPSLRLFFEDVKYLKPIAEILKLAFCPPHFRGNVQEELRRRYVRRPGDLFLVQISEDDFVERTTASPTYAFWSAYRQVCLFIMRHFFGLTNCSPRGAYKYVGRRKQPDTHELWKRFSNLSQKLGFGTPRSPFQSTVDKRPADYVAIYDFLRSLRPPDLFEYSETDLSRVTTDVSSFLAMIRPKAVQVARPFATTEFPRDLPFEERCGMTHVDSFFSDQQYLFIDNIYQDYPPGSYLASFAIKRNFFIAFFGDPDDDSLMTDDPLSENTECGPIIETQVRDFDPMPVDDIASVPVLDLQPASGQLMRHDEVAIISVPTLEPPIAQQPSLEVIKGSWQAMQNTGDRYIGPITVSNASYCVCKTRISPSQFLAYFRNHAKKDYLYLFEYSGDELWCLRNRQNIAEIITQLNAKWVAYFSENCLKVLPRYDPMSYSSHQLLFYNKVPAFSSVLSAEMGDEQWICLPEYDDVAEEWHLSPGEEEL